MPQAEAANPDQFKLRPRTGHGGFTLIEIMIVMVIISIIMSLAVLSINLNQSSILDDEIQRLQSLTSMASEEAVLQGEEIAVELHSNGYQFLRLLQSDDAWQWSPITEDKLFRPRCFPPGLEMKLELEGEPAELKLMTCADSSVVLDEEKEEEKEESTLDEDNENEIPKVFLLSSGELTPFQITLVWEEGGKVTLTGEMTGDLELNAADEDE